MKLILITVILLLGSLSVIAELSSTLFTGTQQNIYNASNMLQGLKTPSTSITPYSSAVGGVSRRATSIFGYDENEVLDYGSQSIGKIVINPIKTEIKFKPKLTVEQYQILLKGWLNSIYENRFESNAWALKYFIRVLAELAFSNRGHIYSSDFNSILIGFENYCKIDSCIAKLDLSSRIKYSLAKLFAAGCIYTRFVDKDITLKAIEIIKKIPKNSILYHIEEQSEELMQEGKIADVESDTMLAPDSKYSNKQLVSDQLGNFIGYEHGENLYYICMSHYDGFKYLPREKQIKFINEIYSYNPTLMEAPPIKVKTYCWDYFIDYFSPNKNPEVMKYCLRGYVNWILLPESI